MVPHFSLPIQHDKTGKQSTPQNRNSSSNVIFQLPGGFAGVSSQTSGGVKFPACWNPNLRVNLKYNGKASSYPTRPGEKHHPWPRVSDDGVSVPFSRWFCKRNHAYIPFMLVCQINFSSQQRLEVERLQTSRCFATRSAHRCLGFDKNDELKQAANRLNRRQTEACLSCRYYHFPKIVLLRWNLTYCVFFFTKGNPC